MCLQIKGVWSGGKWKDLGIDAHCTLHNRPESQLDMLHHSSALLHFRTLEQLQYSNSSVRCTLFHCFCNGMVCTTCTSTLQSAVLRNIIGHSIPLLLLHSHCFSDGMWNEYKPVLNLVPSKLWSPKVACVRNTEPRWNAAFTKEFLHLNALRL